MGAETDEIIEVDVISTVINDENTKEGSENDYTSFFDHEKETGTKEEKKKTKLDSDVIPAKQWVNTIDFLGQKLLPILSQRFGTGIINEKSAALGSTEKKILEPVVSDFLESLGYIKMNPGLALIFAIFGIYGAILIPDIIMAVTFKKSQKQNNNVWPDGFNTNTGFHEQPKETIKPDNNRGRSTTRSRQSDTPKKGRGRPKGTTKTDKYNYSPEEIVEKLKTKANEKG